MMLMIIRSDFVILEFEISDNISVDPDNLKNQRAFLFFVLIRDSPQRRARRVFLREPSCLCDFVVQLLTSEASQLSRAIDQDIKHDSEKCDKQK
jgi:hypothetical protein